MLRAMAALQGADGALAAHRKVPGEILLAYLFAGSLGQIVEHVARLPYALAGVGAVLAFFSLARKLLGGPAALVAGLLLAVNGYFVAFGRILQYDSLAFFLGIAGLICCWRFGRTAHDPDQDASAPDDADDRAPIVWAFLGALLLSGAALVALGAIFLVLPALRAGVARPGPARPGVAEPPLVAGPPRLGLAGRARRCSRRAWSSGPAILRAVRAASGRTSAPASAASGRTGTAPCSCSRPTITSPRRTC